MDNSEHIFRGQNLDGIRCPYCDGLVNVIRVSGELYEKLPKYRDLKKKQAQPNEIEIIMTNVNEPPKIKLNGKEIEDIVTLEYMYVSKESEYSNGVHNFMVQYYDKETKTIRTVSANRIGEGKG